jgi:hypothetical protein
MLKHANYNCSVLSNNRSLILYDLKFSRRLNSIKSLVDKSPPPPQKKSFYPQVTRFVAREDFIEIRSFIVSVHHMVL